MCCTRPNRWACFVAILLCAGPAALTRSAVAAGPIYRDDEKHFQVSLPEGWCKMPAADLERLGHVIGQLQFDEKINYEARFCPQFLLSVLVGLTCSGLVVGTWVVLHRGRSPRRPESNSSPAEEDVSKVLPGPASPGPGESPPAFFILSPSRGWSQRLYRVYPLLEELLFIAVPSNQGTTNKVLLGAARMVQGLARLNGGLLGGAVAGEM